MFFGGFLEEFYERSSLGGVFWEEFFGKYEMNFFVRISLREIFWEGCFERNSLFTLLKSAKLFEYGRN